MSINLDGQMAIVTGAGRGLGRSHALALATRGARLVVNDLGDENGVSENANAVVAEIEASGGEAFAHGASVADNVQVEDMVAKAMEKWGRVDILINNAGILRDKTFLKMTLDDFRLVIDVHLMGTPTAPRPYGRSCASSNTAASCLRVPARVFTVTSARQTTAPRKWRWSDS